MDSLGWGARTKSLTTQLECSHPEPVEKPGGERWRRRPRCSVGDQVETNLGGNVKKGVKRIDEWEPNIFCCFCFCTTKTDHQSSSSELANMLPPLADLRQKPTQNCPNPTSRYFFTGPMMPCPTCEHCASAFPPRSP